MLLFWYILPWWFYKKTQLFKYDWQFSFDFQGANLVCEHGEAAWNWSEVQHYFESPLFFHFYFFSVDFIFSNSNNVFFTAASTVLVGAISVLSRISNRVLSFLSICGYL